MDNIQYKMADGSNASNPDLLTNRLWLNMGYAPDQNNVFKGTLSYNKAYGDSVSHQQSNISGTTALNTFDWVTNENATDNTLKVKEAYWLYMNDTFLGTEHPWTASFGRRPSTDGLGINLRENSESKSPLAHTVNVEFDGASFKFDNLLPTPGDSFKICLGRGLTNAAPRFDMMNPAYSSVDKTGGEIQKDVNMYGFIFVPYDNGQYSIATNVARADHLIGFDMGMSDVTGPNFAGWNPTTSPDFMTTTTFGSTVLPTGYKFKDFGSLDLYTVMLKAEGIGSGINAFLDDTKVFASWAMSKTDPKSGMMMLGSPNSETGHSIWLGVNAPCPLTADGRWGVEWNKGSKYWRSVTYAEDTMAGSKLAARGTALEVYYNKPLTKALEGSLRFTQIKYDYTGSNSFFGEDGAPLSLAEGTMLANALGMAAPVEKANDFRVAVTYKF
jgi:hypothetical protein